MTDLAAWLTQIWDEEERQANRAVGDVAAMEIDNYGHLTVPAPWVLARIAAVREILALHCRVVRFQWAGTVAYGCATCKDNSPAQDDDTWPCQTALLLALPHADRPGYREEWQP